MLLTGLLIWALVLWLGWLLLFSAGDGSVLHGDTGARAEVVERFYFTGCVLFTLGNGDFVPDGSVWQIATALASLSGLVLVTLSVSYIVSLLQGAVQKCSLASQVLALGRTADELVANCWDRGGFRGMELQLVSLTEQLNAVTERHKAYPLLHFYHAAEEVQSLATALAVMDESLTILELAVRPEVQPGQAALRCGESRYACSWRASAREVWALPRRPRTYQHSAAYAPPVFPWRRTR